MYEQPASVYEANGSQPVEYVQPPALLTCAAPAVTHATRLTPMIQRLQKTVEVPQILYVDKIVDAPVVASHQPVRMSPSGRRLFPGRENFPWRPSLLTGVSDAEHGLVRGRSAGLKWTRLVKGTRQKKNLDLLLVAPNMEAGGSHLHATAEEERIVDWTRDLRDIRRVVEFLVRRERKLDVKADVAVSRNTPNWKMKNAKPASQSGRQDQSREARC